ncbi:hypothetical protein EV644_110227 [Kribbella orskensis]|uniref:Uncharacterized protein n=1 Tax=Kribbella orskensis TaxID=2512216 RepID=A0ABY2BGP4_9ACTN|nr:hypothetical protein EV642_110249 [Kribbella sp. VKM Ac-2500]TCO19577.1 hypothetical protein EV644_110227 [Kribbella orskensis]
MVPPAPARVVPTAWAEVVASGIGGGGCVPGLRDGASRAGVRQERFASLRDRASSTLDPHHPDQGRNAAIPEPLGGMATRPGELPRPNARGVACPDVRGAASPRKVGVSLCPDPRDSRNRHFVHHLSRSRRPDAQPVHKVRARTPSRDLGHDLTCPRSPHGVRSPHNPHRHRPATAPPPAVTPPEGVRGPHHRTPSAPRPATGLPMTGCSAAGALQAASRRTPRQPTPQRAARRRPTRPTGRQTCQGSNNPPVVDDLPVVEQPVSASPRIAATTTPRGENPPSGTAGVPTDRK